MRVLSVIIILNTLSLNAYAQNSCDEIKQSVGFVGYPAPSAKELKKAAYLIKFAPEIGSCLYPMVSSEDISGIDSTSGNNSVERITIFNWEGFSFSIADIHESIATPRHASLVVGTEYNP